MSTLDEFKLNAEQLEDARTTLINKDFRDMYEKVGQITTRAEH